MRLLTLWSTPYTGGAAKRFVELVDGLSLRGIDVVLLSVHDYVGHAVSCMERVSLPQGRLRAVRTWLSRKPLIDIKRLLDRHKPDRVFAFGLVNASVVCSVAHENGIPSALFIRGMELVLANNHNVPFGYVPAVGSLGRWLYSMVFRHYSRAIMGQTDSLVFQHHEQFRAYSQGGLLPPDFKGAIHFLPNNANPTWLQQVQSHQPQGDPVAVIAARLVLNKGFRVAFDAFRLVKHRVGDARLLVLGDGRHAEAVHRYAENIEGIEFVGHVDELDRYLASAGLLIHPAIYELGCPNIILEAAARGMPMIVSSELAHTVGSKSWVYPSRDHNRLADLWVRALTDKEYYATLCHESRRLGEEYRFDWVGKAQAVLSSLGNAG